MIFEELYIELARGEVTRKDKRVAKKMRAFSLKARCDFAEAEFADETAEAMAKLGLKCERFDDDEEDETEE